MWRWEPAPLPPKCRYWGFPQSPGLKSAFKWKKPPRLQILNSLIMHFNADFSGQFTRSKTGQPFPTALQMSQLVLFRVFNIREPNPSKTQTNKCITWHKGRWLSSKWIPHMVWIWDFIFILHICFFLTNMRASPQTKADIKLMLQHHICLQPNMQQVRRCFISV